VRPLGPFGADDAIRVTVGTREENEFFVTALTKVVQRGTRRSFAV
jgi:histidinol-phosphate/aromatic aminotransferase/cobyric acid decarboxylase-like protein